MTHRFDIEADETRDEFVVYELTRVAIARFMQADRAEEYVAFRQFGVTPEVSAEAQATQTAQVRCPFCDQWMAEPCGSAEEASRAPCYVDPPLDDADTAAAPTVRPASGPLFPACPYCNDWIVRPCASADEAAQCHPSPNGVGRSRGAPPEPEPDRSPTGAEPEPATPDEAEDPDLPEDDLLALAFQRLKDGEKLGLVADDIGMPMPKLRSEWARYQKARFARLVR